MPDRTDGFRPLTHPPLEPLQRPGERLVSTHCCFCGMQCAFYLRVSERDNRVVGLEPRYDWPTNEGRLCPKGIVAYHQLYHPDRLLKPLVRRNGRLVEAGWDEALDRVVEGIRFVQSVHGKDAFAVYGGASMTTEKAYLAGKFARLAIGTRNIDYNGRLCMSSAAAAYNKAFGIDRAGALFSDVVRTDCLLICGANPPETLPTSMAYIWQALDNGARLIVVDPRETAIARAAALHLQVRPGTDAALYMAMLHVLIEADLIDKKFIAARTRGFEETAAAVKAIPPERAEKITGVPAADISTAARWYGEAHTAMILHARGVEHHAQGTENALCLINLALATGKIGRPGCGCMTLTGQGNGQGGREHGQKADQLPGYRKITDPAARAHIARVWGVREEDIPGPGYSAVELFEAMERGEVRGLYLMCSNPLVSLPSINRFEKALRKLDFFVAADFFLSETARQADVVLPVTVFAEEEGTTTNLEGRVVRRNKVVDPPPDIPTDWQLMCELARRLGKGRYFPYTTVREIFDELRLASRGGVADYHGITYEKIDAQKGVFWPCPTVDHPGTPRLFAERFYHEDGRAVMHPVEYKGPDELPDDDYSLRYTTGRVVYHFLSGNQTRRIPFLRDLAPDPYVEIHPETASRHGIQPGDWVRVTSRRGSLVLRALVTAAIRPDTVFIPYHWGNDVAANLLTLPSLDPSSRMPELKAVAVRIEKAEEPAGLAREPYTAEGPEGAAVLAGYEGPNSKEVEEFAESVRH